MLGHLISFVPYRGSIIFWKGEEVCEQEIFGKELHARFSDSILCTGYQTLDTEHRTLKTYNKCPHKLRGYKQCSHCKNQDISKVYTRLDFTGYEEMHDEYVHQNFSIYLAQFGDSIVKCGVTRSERVEERTREQGADFWVELMRFDNGEDAYRMEIELQQRFGLRNFVRNDAKLKLLTEHATAKKEKTKCALESKLNEIKIELETKQCESNKSGESSEHAGFVFCESEIVENIYPVPDSFELAYSIDGTVVGSKSKMLFYEKDGKHFLVPMYDAIGRIFLMKD